MKKLAQLSVVLTKAQGDRDALLLDELTDEEVATLIVLRRRVEVGVVGDGVTCLVVHRLLGWEGVPV